MIDPRLLECASAAQIEENMNRLLAMIDKLNERIGAQDDGTDADGT